jgi:hypothetical protein
MLRAAVLDACVLYPITLTDSLLTAAERGFYAPRWSRLILEEVRDSIIESGGVRPEDAEARILAMMEAFPEAMVDGFEHLVSAMGNDPKDRHVLAAAVASNSPLLVTTNLRDFPEEACAPFGVEVLSPDDLLNEFFLEEPDIVLDMLADQASAYEYPPFTLEDLLDALTRHAPGFAWEVRQYAHSLGR